MRRGMDSRLVVSRFRYERQILAGLEHPNIARLLDGGATEDGRPYFVMEYVEGVPIDTYCSRNGLPVRRKLELFRQVCAAVQHAHQNLVVHRDLKPGNILVGEDGVPKLLDFGIAKLLRQEAPRETALTQLGMRLMTPEYASPEQVRGLPVTTATDVYSLGVVLYELLAGKPPYTFATHSPLELDRVICEQEPPPPSRAAGADARSVVGDLDLIVLKAMEKDPQRRYVSAEQLSEDIRRHLERLPVMARPHTLMYRASRFVRRNRTAVAAGVVVAISLAAGLVATAWQAHVAQRERSRAERRFNDVRRLANSFLFEFDEKIRDLAGATPARRLAVERAREYLGSLSQESAGDASLQRELAEAYLKIGDVQGNPYVSNLGDTAGALSSYKQALEIAREVHRAHPADGAATLYLARAHRSIGEVMPLLGDAAGAIPHLKDAVALLEPAARDETARFELATSYEMLGDVTGHSGIQSFGDRKGARAWYEKALAVNEAIAREHAGNVRGRRGVAVLRMKIGDLESEAGEMQAAMGHYQASASALEALSAADPENAILRRLFASVTRKVGLALAAGGDLPAAMRHLAKAAGIQQELIAADPSNGQARMDFAVTLRNVGDVQYQSGNAARSLEAYQKALELMTALAAAEPNNKEVRGRYAIMLVYVGDVLAETGQKAEALRLCREGLKILKELADRPGATASSLMDYAQNLVDCPLTELKDPAAAVAYARRGVEMTNYSAPGYMEALARAHFAAGNAAEAVTMEQKAIALLAPSPARKAAEARLARFQAALRK
jgi:non-specific serine/threonine protein kinase/serine/threonine-protein kinase